MKERNDSGSKILKKVWTSAVHSSETYGHFISQDDCHKEGSEVTNIRRLFAVVDDDFILLRHSQATIQCYGQQQMSAV